MNQKKLKLIVSILLVMVLLMVTLNAGVFADTIPFYSNTSTDTGEIPSVNTNSEGSTPVANTNTNTNINTSTNTNVNTNTNTNTNAKNSSKNNIANTGIEDLFGSRSVTWIVIGFCVVSVIFAYKKIKEYNIG